MAVTYGKPSLTGLPPELGRRIFEQILNSKPVTDAERAVKTKAAIERIKKAEKEALEKQKCDQ